MNTKAKKQEFGVKNGINLFGDILIEDAKKLGLKEVKELELKPGLKFLLVGEEKNNYLAYCYYIQVAKIEEKKENERYIKVKVIFLTGDISNRYVEGSEFEHGRHVFRFFYEKKAPACSAYLYEKIFLVP